MRIAFTVACTPEPQGSLQSFIIPNRDAAFQAATQILNFAGRCSVDAAAEIIRQYSKRLRAILTSDNSDLKAYRTVVATAARQALAEAGIQAPMAARHVPVELTIKYTFVRPKSVSAKRLYPVVKPDIDKLERATLDAITGILMEDDAQSVLVTHSKVYGPVAQVHLMARTMETPSLFPA